MLNDIEENLNKIIENTVRISHIMPNDTQDLDLGTVSDLSDAHQEYLNILTLIDTLIEKADTALSQYIDIEDLNVKNEDPNVILLTTLKENVLEAKEELESCSNDLDFIISEIDVGDSIDSVDLAIYNYELDTFFKIINKTLKEFNKK